MLIKGIFLFIVTMVFLLVISILVFNNMGAFLVIDNDIIEVDAIVVLMGGPTTTVRDAAELYLSGYAELIIMAQTVAKSGEQDPVTGLLSSGETERSRLILIDFGVPEEVIIIIPSMTRSTRDEAEAVRDYLSQRQDIDSLILITKGYHTRRSVITFTRALRSLDRDVKLISRASRYDPFQAENWWLDHSSKRHVALEYAKIINYYFLDLFNVELNDTFEKFYFIKNID